MLRKLGIVELHQAIKNKVESKTGISCYDIVPEDTPAPFYFVELVGKRESNSKTMYRDVMTVWIHAIAEESESSIGIYDLIGKLEEALTEHIELPENVELAMQTEVGLQNIKTDETNEKHATMAWEFTISYGFRTKN